MGGRWIKNGGRAGGACLTRSHHWCVKVIPGGGNGAKALLGKKKKESKVHRNDQGKYFVTYGRVESGRMCRRAGGKGGKMLGGG